MDGELLGYITTRVFEGPAYLGGVLIVDKKGIPVEFKYIEPIKPSKLQTLLYGNTIDRYIRVESVGIPLINALEHKPVLLFVREEPFLEESKWSFPVISISRYKGDMLTSMGEYKELEDGGYIIQIDSGMPVRARIEKKYLERLTEIISTLTEVGQNFDIMEPFSRLEEAIRFIWREHRRS
ncbi:TPA: hypothetical protein GXX44_03445 [bacterium]|jgi:hypothetical protein|nr:hypothetical protein [bacterium]